MKKPWVPIECTAKTLIRPGRCPGWVFAGCTGFVGFVMVRLTYLTLITKKAQRTYLLDGSEVGVLWAIVVEET